MHLRELCCTPSHELNWFYVTWVLNLGVTAHILKKRNIPLIISSVLVICYFSSSDRLDGSTLSITVRLFISPYTPSLIHPSLHVLFLLIILCLPQAISVSHLHLSFWIILLSKGANLKSESVPLSSTFLFRPFFLPFFLINPCLQLYV